MTTHTCICDDRWVTVVPMKLAPAPPFTSRRPRTGCSQAASRMLAGNSGIARGDKLGRIEEFLELGDLAVFYREYVRPFRGHLAIRLLEFER